MGKTLKIFSVKLNGIGFKFTDSIVIRLPVSAKHNNHITARALHNGFVNFLPDVHLAIKHEHMDLRVIVKAEIVSDINTYSDNDSDIFAVDDAIKNSLGFAFADQLATNIHLSSSILNRCNEGRKVNIYTLLN
ncbi:hypothetical protein [Xenorhabdus bovienii]|uniref:hypothetical protein n=1 Tax=Xenorhabdus bovienii TaxID=40576 RepID=UPI0023B09DD5|nr:hypothetical protein [Xenorhabdus bovienii]MDE9478727.1 hypothetical protein [Xenorhabdus bovienii]MDE9531680.1 hypothetical protein [Xenorhabdus bovienii]